MNTAQWLDGQFGLHARRALVTGARTGIGRTSALALAAAGADLLLWGRETEGLASVEAEVRALGARVDTVGVDLHDIDAVRSTAAQIADEGQIDIIVNCAGIIRRGPAIEAPWSDWRDVMNVNLDAIYALTSAFLPQMLERKSGKVVNIASLLSFQGGVNVASYTASKHALVGLTKALSNELAPHGINVNAIAPGYIETNNTEALRADSARREQISSRIPAGRWGRPEDLSGAVCFLCSPAAAYVHGHVLVVDGGWLAW